jgi:hypothetical protein
MDSIVTVELLALHDHRNRGGTREMKVEIIAIGDELTSGGSSSTTSSYAARQLFGAGLRDLCHAHHRRPRP